jgi:hypothetical protein
MASDKKPRFFVAWAEDGLYGHKLLSYPTPGTNHYYAVRNDPGTYWWYFNIDGGAREHEREFDSSKFIRGHSLGSSERESLSDTNYSHFWNLKSMDAYLNWYWWRDTYCRLDDDPEYWFNKISDTEFYVQK